MPKLSTGALLTALLIAAPAWTPSWAGTIRDDRSDSLYTSLAADPLYDAVGKVLFTKNGGTYLGSGVLLSSQWVLTAGHCVSDPTAPVTVTNFSLANGYGGGATTWFANPNYSPSAQTGTDTSGNDIGLIKLATPVNVGDTGIMPASRYTGSTERYNVMTMVGYGLTGTGLTGATQPAGTKRAGQNYIDGYGGGVVGTVNLSG